MRTTDFGKEVDLLAAAGIVVVRFGCTCCAGLASVHDGVIAPNGLRLRLDGAIDTGFEVCVPAGSTAVAPQILAREEAAKLLHDVHTLLADGVRWRQLQALLKESST